MALFFRYIINPQPSTLNRHQTINHTTVNPQPSIIIKPSIINPQPSTVNHQSSTVNHQTINYIELMFAFCSVYDIEYESACQRARC